VLTLTGMGVSELGSMGVLFSSFYYLGLWSAGRPFGTLLGRASDGFRGEGLVLLLPYLSYHRNSDSVD
jgi:hypothetical protein